MAAVPGHMHLYGWNDWWMGVGMLIFWVVMIGVVVAVAVAFARSGTGHDRDVGPRQPRDLLAERYAIGDIDTEEFRSRSRELEKAGR